MLPKHFLYVPIPLFSLCCCIVLTKLCMWVCSMQKRIEIAQSLGRESTPDDKLKINLKIN